MNGLFQRIQRREITSVVGSSLLRAGGEKETTSGDSNRVDKTAAIRRPEECIVENLHACGGRVRQQTLCEMTRWSEATISRTLSEMEENDRIQRVRIGREYAVCLPDALPESDRRFNR